MCKSWERAATDERLWAHQCKVRCHPPPATRVPYACSPPCLAAPPPQGLWEGKWVPERFRSLPSSRTAYWASLVDSQRADIREEELCGVPWGFRCGAAAGEGGGG